MKSKLKETSGFTLVELIVVIAVLGILAGVGGVAYAGYIERANKAVDEQLVADVKYAAILGGMSDPDATGEIHVGKDEMSVEGDPEYRAGIEGWLKDAFGADWNRLHTKTLEAVVYVPVLSVTLTEKQKELLENYINSNFHGHEEELVATVENLTGMFGDWLEDGGDLSGYMPDGQYEKFLEQYGLNAGSPAIARANAMVMFLGAQASEMTDDDVNELYNLIISGEVREENLLPDLAAFYGVMTGYANSEYASEDFKTLLADNPPTGVSTVQDVLLPAFIEEGEKNYENFVGYLGLDPSGEPTGPSQAKADLDGYLSALSLIKDFDDQIDINDENAFHHDATSALLQETLNGAKSS